MTKINLGKVLGELATAYDVLDVRSNSMHLEVKHGGLELKATVKPHSPLGPQFAAGAKRWADFEVAEGTEVQLTGLKVQYPRRDLDAAIKDALKLVSDAALKSAKHVEPSSAAAAQPVVDAVSAYMAAFNARQAHNAPSPFPDASGICVEPVQSRPIGFVAATGERATLAPGFERAYGRRPTPRSLASKLNMLSTWDFQEAPMRDAPAAGPYSIVGARYRSDAEKKALQAKRANNLALVVPEPTNPVSSEALAVLVWDMRTSAWVHVGYLRQLRARRLKPAIDAMLAEGGTCLVARLDAVHPPAEHSGGPYSTLILTGSFRKYEEYNTTA